MDSLFPKKLFCPVWVVDRIGRVYDAAVTRTDHECIYAQRTGRGEECFSFKNGQWESFGDILVFDLGAETQNLINDRIKKYTDEFEDAFKSAHNTYLENQKRLTETIESNSRYYQTIKLL